MPLFDIIVAVDNAMGIGVNGVLPWNLPTDLARFKKLTGGGGEDNGAQAEEKLTAVIMGKGTWMGLPRKPLPKRKNVVLSKTGLEAEAEADGGVEVCNSLNNALKLTNDCKQRFVIGGAGVYKEALAHRDLDKIYMTRVDTVVPCDRHFPDVEKTFTVVGEEDGGCDNGINFKYQILQKRRRIAVDPAYPVVIVDSSYLVFNRYNATLRWYSYKTPVIDHSAITKDPEFVEAFIRHLQKDLKKFKVPHKNIIFCYDCPRRRIWRMPHHTEYKGNRVPATTFNPDIFRVFYEHIDEKGYHIAKMPTLEADDVACLVSSSPELAKCEIIFITNDNDYLQLLGPGRTIRNMQGIDLATRSCGDPNKDLLIKILMGDKSDNIPAVFTACGKKTAEKLADDPELLLKTLTAKGAHEQFAKNRILIDMNYIPNDLVKMFRNKYNICVQGL